MKKIILYFSCIFFFINCSKEKDEDVIIPAETRNFYMGVTPWPGNFNFADLDIAYDFINNHCDIVSHHFDEGIPYEEAFNNQAMPTGLQQQVLYRNTKTNNDKKILLSVSALNLDRNQRAAYYNTSTVSASIQQQWMNKEFNDPTVITAYINYLNYLIAGFQPDYINFGVESNVDTFDAAEFFKYKDFLSQVYASLKNSHPTIPLFTSFIVNNSNQGFQYATQLLPYTDYIGISAYPFTALNGSLTGETNPNTITANYFEKYINMANKPFCFAETAYIAEDLVVPFYGLNKQGNQEWQKAYLQKVLDLCQNYNAEFLIWFCSKDYDQGNLYLQQQGLYFDLLAIWQDTGLIDQDGNQRLSYSLWENRYLKTKN